MARPAPARRLTLGLVAGLTDRKLAQKIEPLAALDEVAAIDLYRRRPFAFDKVRWQPIPSLLADRPAAGDLARLLRLLAGGRRCDLLIGCHQPFHGVLADIVRRVHRKPIIQMVLTDVDWLMARPLLGRTLLAADAIGVRGPRAAGRLRDLGYAGPIEIVDNPMPLGAARPADRTTGDLLAVGDLAPEKDYPTLLEALAAVRRRRPATTLTLVGGGPFAAVLGPIVDRLGLGGAVAWPGSLTGPDLDRLRATSRLAVLSSRVEGLPMVVLEAMASGLPVVATAVGELPGLIDRSFGRLAPAGDATALAAAILEVLDCDDLRRSLAAGARRAFEDRAERFSIEAIGQRWRALFAALGIPGDG